jgi:putative hydrolase of the HAD superfamily
MQQAFSHVTHWVFDLDNTLYPPEAALFDQIEVLMTDYVMRELKVDRARANHLRDHYWRKYGTTLSGMMTEHDVDPEPYLVQVHDITLDHMLPDPILRRLIQNLPGRKIVYTNGSRFHAERVTEARGLTGVFDALYGIEHANFLPKPQRRAFETIFALDGTDPARAAMFEDDARNLAGPKEMGMKTVLVGSSPLQPFIDHHTHDLNDFLSQLVA